MGQTGSRQRRNRRAFLKGIAAVAATGAAGQVLGGAAWLARDTGVDSTPEPPPLSGVAATGELDKQLYLPLVTKQELPILAHGGSKIGLHTLQPGKSIDFVHTVHDAGTHVTLVKAVSDFSTLYWVKHYSPETTTIGRSMVDQAVDPSEGDPNDVAANMMSLHMEQWHENGNPRDYVDYWEVLNENDPPTMAGHVWLAQFYIACMGIAEANGFKLAIMSYSTGVPQWHEWEAIVETGVFGRAKEGGHILALHEYDWPISNYLWGEPTEDMPSYEDRGVLNGRYRYLYRDFLIPRGEVIPLAITECGLDPVLVGAGHPDPPEAWQERYVQEMIWADTRWREDNYVIGGAMFTLGGYGAWVNYDYAELLWPDRFLLPDWTRHNNSYEDNFYDYVVSLKDA